jgi:hypothetical protein
VWGAHGAAAGIPAVASPRLGPVGVGKWRTGKVSNMVSVAGTHRKGGSTVRRQWWLQEAVFHRWRDSGHQRQQRHSPTSPRKGEGGEVHGKLYPWCMEKWLTKEGRGQRFLTIPVRQHTPVTNDALDAKGGEGVHGRSEKGARGKKGHRLRRSAPFKGGHSGEQRRGGQLGSATWWKGWGGPGTAIGRRDPRRSCG